MEDYRVFEYAAIDPNYLRLYDISLLAGRNLTMADTTGNILINKTLVKNLELGSPQDAVGAELKMGSQRVTVVGVVNDFYSNSLKEGVDNLVMLVREENFSTLNVKLNVTDETGSLQEPIPTLFLATSFSMRTFRHSTLRRTSMPDCFNCSPLFSC
jgi:hypothetical protein